MKKIFITLVFIVTSNLLYGADYEWTTCKILRGGIKNDDGANKIVFALKNCDKSNYNGKWVELSSSQEGVGQTVLINAIELNREIKIETLKFAGDDDPYLRQVTNFYLEGVTSSRCRIVRGGFSGSVVKFKIIDCPGKNGWYKLNDSTLGPIFGLLTAGGTVPGGLISNSEYIP